MLMGKMGRPCKQNSAFSFLGLLLLFHFGGSFGICEFSSSFEMEDGKQDLKGNYH